MTARPGQWELLSGPMRPVHEDPLPTEPYDIWDRGNDLVTIAYEIRQQRDRLRHLSGTDSGIKGLYADELADGMEELADDLDKADERFDKVGKLIRDDFHEVYSTARTKTKSALVDAEDAQGRAKNNEEPEGDAEEEESAKTDRENRLETANGDLVAARNAFASAMSDFHNDAEDVAKKIKKASDDDMKDGFWDKVAGVIDAIAPLLKFIKLILAIVTIALLIAAFWWAAPFLLIVGLAAVSLAISVALAATGNGTWTDVALDTIGLLTLGVGKIAVGLAKLGRFATKVRTILPAASRAFANAGRGFRGFASGVGAGYRALVRPIPILSGRFNAAKGIFGDDVVALQRDFAALAREYPGLKISGVKALEVAKNINIGGFQLGVYQGGNELLNSPGTVTDFVDWVGSR